MSRFNLGLNQKNFNGSRPTSTAAINMGSTKGRGSSTRMFNFCKTHSEAPSLCIDQFINITGGSSPPPPTTTPSAPTITSITPGDQLLILYFTPPSSDGGSSITNYQYSINGGTYINANTTTTPITITGLTNGTTYSLGLRAVNSIGPGAESNIVSGTPVAPFVTTFTFNTYSSVTSTSSNITSLDYVIFPRVAADLISVVIGTSCTSIGNNCFENCTNLSSVTVPNSVTSFGDSSFRNCTSLTSITIPNSVTLLDIYCFAECTGLTTITIPNSVTTLRDSVFLSCDQLQEVIFEAGSTITILPSQCFTGCFKLASINIPSSVLTILNSCFLKSCKARYSGCSLVIGKNIVSLIP
jgi:hypothetical protein